MALLMRVRDLGSASEMYEIREEGAIVFGAAAVEGGERPQNQAARKDDRSVRIFENSPVAPNRPLGLVAWRVRKAPRSS